MSLTLDDALVPGWLQLLNSGRLWLDKAEASGIAEQELLSARLFEDMLPFAYQVKSMAVHSRGAVEGVRAGLFSPDMTPPPQSIAQLRSSIEESIRFLQVLPNGELEKRASEDMRFEVGPKRLDFTVQDFLLSFSQPNFFFHAGTAYGILRMKGVKVGKLDYLGKLRLKQA